MNIGREIVASLLGGEDITILTESGMNKAWLATPSAEVIFTGNDKKAYQWILEYYSRHHKIPRRSVFEMQFPPESYDLPEAIISLDELSELAGEKVNSYLVADIIGKVIDLHDAGKIDAAISFLKAESSKISGTKIAQQASYDIASPSFDLEKLLNTELPMGIPFGIEPIDQAFWGFQPGQLVTLMGRQKSGKSWMTLNSAYRAWREGFSILFFSVEMGEELLTQRLLSLGAHVSPSRMRRGILHDNDKDKVRKFHDEIKGQGSGRFVISRKKTLITVDDIIDEVTKYRPHIVYIDGFSFMVDRRTGKMTDDWQANENVAAELKSLAMEKELVIFVNTQVQEKQYSARAGIEARAIQGGTGLLKAADLVIGQDKDGDVMTFTSQRSRFEEFDEVDVEVDFDHMEFSVIQNRAEEMGA